MEAASKSLGLEDIEDLFEEFPDEHQYLSNFCCLPGRAGGSLKCIRSH